MERQLVLRKDPITTLVAGGKNAWPRRTGPGVAPAARDAAVAFQASRNSGGLMNWMHVDPRHNDVLRVL